MAEALKVMEKPPYSEHPPPNPLFFALSVTFFVRSTMSLVGFATDRNAVPRGANLPVESSHLFMAPASPNSITPASPKTAQFSTAGECSTTAR